MAFVTGLVLFSPSSETNQKIYLQNLQFNIFTIMQRVYFLIFNKQYCSECEKAKATGEHK